MVIFSRITEGLEFQKWQNVSGHLYTLKFLKLQGFFLKKTTEKMGMFGCRFLQKCEYFRKKLIYQKKAKNVWEELNCLTNGKIGWFWKSVDNCGLHLSKPSNFSTFLTLAGL